MPDGLDATEPLKNISTETLTAAVEDARSPLIVTDYSLPDNPIVYSNRAFQELTGYRMNEIIGRNCRFLQGDDTNQEAVAQLRKAVIDQTYVRVNLKNYKKDGTPFWNDLVMSPVKNAKGETTHFLGMQLDITDRVIAEQKLLAKTTELEQSNRDLEQFTYATSHDLQEPLRMISSYLQLINKRYGDKLDENGQTFLGYATEGAERMQGLIYDLLTLSKVSTAREKLKIVNLAKSVEQAQYNLKLMIEETNAIIEVSKLPDIQVDPVQIAQLFQNLIGNAIKYRADGVRPCVKISAKQNGNCYIITVADNGIGIDSQYFDRIFGVFQRLHTRNEYSGNGVGLAICARIVERHNGKIWVNSTKGKGTTFSISLPAKHEEQNCA